MSAAPKPARRLLPWKGSTFVVIVFLATTILPAFVAFALTPPDARVVTNVQGWNGCAYSVRRGDNLFRIGVRYGVTYHYLAQINGIYNPNYVYAGQVISVPCGAVHYPDYQPHYRPKDKKYYPPYECPWCYPFDIPVGCAASIQYTVQPGDNLFRIAVYNGSTIQWIRTENDLWGKVLRPGVTLNIPCPGYVTTYPAYLYTGTPPTPGIVTATFVPTVVPNDNIRMRNNRFNPASKTVRIGTTVTWENREAEGGPAYTVTSGSGGVPDGQFSSGPVAPGGAFSFTFTVAGSYAYYSETNPQEMVAEIIVTQ